MITLDEALEFLGIVQPTQAQEDLIRTLITLVTAEIENYCDTILAETEIEDETLAYTSYDYDLELIPLIQIRAGTPIIVLRHVPVTDLVIEQDSVVVPSDNYTLYENVGIIVPKIRLQTRDKLLTASYTAGLEPVPAVLKLVALQGVKAYYADSGGVSQGNSNIKSKSLDRFSVSYGNSNQLNGGGGERTYIVNNKSILDKFKRIYIWG